MNSLKFDTNIHLDLFDNRDEIIRYIRVALGFHPELVYKYSNQIKIFLQI